MLAAQQLQKSGAQRLAEAEVALQRIWNSLSQENKQRLRDDQRHGSSGKIRLALSPEACAQALIYRLLVS
jgi:hypothetical protein